MYDSDGSFLFREPLMICYKQYISRRGQGNRPFYTFTDRITDHPGSSLRDHPCYLRHYRVYTGETSGVILGVPAYPGKKLSLLNFSSRSSRMKQSVLFPVGTVYLRVAAECIRDSPCRHREVRINTGFIRV